MGSQPRAWKLCPRVILCPVHSCPGGWHGKAASSSLIPRCNTRTCCDHVPHSSSLWVARCGWERGSLPRPVGGWEGCSVTRLDVGEDGSLAPRVSQGFFDSIVTCAGHSTSARLSSLPVPSRASGSPGIDAFPSTVSHRLGLRDAMRMPARTKEPQAGLDLFPIG